MFARPVSSTMPNVPSASPGGDIFARAPRYAASSKSWMAALPLSARCVMDARAG